MQWCLFKGETEMVDRLEYVFESSEVVDRLLAKLHVMVSLVEHIQFAPSMKDGDLNEKF